jgi:hypothetical protein
MTNGRNERDEFKTSDIDVGAFLTAHNIPMVGVIPDQDHLTFVFGGQRDCALMAQRFLSGDDTVSARSLLSAARHLRRLVRESL